MDKNEIVNKKGCMGCGWVLVVPIGCFTAIALFLSIAALLYILWGAAMTPSATICKNAAEIALRSPAVIEALGEPVEVGFAVKGSINIDGSQKMMDFAIPVSGPKGNGVLYVVGTEKGNALSYSKLEVKLEKSEIIIKLLK